MIPGSPEFHWSNRSLLRLSAFGFGMVGFLLAMDTVILPVLVLDVAPESLKNTYLAVLGGAGLVVAGTVQPLIGRLSDKTRSPLGRRIPYLLWGCMMVCLGLVGVGLASSYIVLLLVWLFVQANLNIGYGPYQALIRDLVPLDRIGLASSIKIISDAAGSLVLIVAAGVLIERTSGPEFINWKWVTLALVAVVLIGSTTVTSITVRARETALEVTRRVEELIQRPSRGLHPHLKRFLLSRLLIITAITALPTYGLFFLRDSVGLENPAQSLSTMIPAIGAAFVLAAYPVGWLSNRVGRKPVIMAGAIGASASAAWMLSANSFGDVLVTATVMGASVGVLMSSNWALANDLSTDGNEGMHMGIVNLATTGGAAASKLVGPGIDLLNRTSDGVGYDALLITCSTLFFLGALVLMPLKVATPGAYAINRSPRGAG